MNIIPIIANVEELNHQVGSSMRSRIAENTPTYVVPRRKIEEQSFDLSGSDTEEMSNLSGKFSQCAVSNPSHLQDDSLNDISFGKSASYISDNDNDSSRNSNNISLERRDEFLLDKSTEQVSRAHSNAEARSSRYDQGSSYINNTHGNLSGEIFTPDTTSKLQDANISRKRHTYTSSLSSPSQCGSDESFSSTDGMTAQFSPRPDLNSLAYLYRNLYKDRLDYRRRKLSVLEPYDRRKRDETSSLKASRKGLKTNRQQLQKEVRGHRHATRKQIILVDKPIVVKGSYGTHTISSGKPISDSRRTFVSSHADWLKHKAKEDQRRRTEEARQQEKILEIELERQREKQKMKERGKEEYARWLQEDKRKLKKMKKKQKEERRRAMQEREEQLAKIMADTDENYKEWLYDYHIRRRKIDAAERKKRREQAELRHASKQRGVAAYQQWLREVAVRPKSRRFEQPKPWHGVLENNDIQVSIVKDIIGKDGDRDCTDFVPSPPLLFRDIELAKMLAVRRR